MIQYHIREESNNFEKKKEIPSKINFIMMRIAFLFYFHVWPFFTTAALQTSFNKLLNVPQKPNINGMIESETPTDANATLQMIGEGLWDLSSKIEFFSDKNSPIIKPTFNYTFPINMRVDTNSSIMINTSLQGIGNFKLIDLIAQVGVILAGNSLPIYLVFGQQISAFANKAVNIASINGYLKNGSGIWFDLTKSIINEGQVNNHTFDIISILRSMCQIDPSILLCNSTIQNIFYQMRINVKSSGSSAIGTIHFKASAFISQNCTTGNLTLPMNQYLLDHFSKISLSSQEYSNVSRPASDSLVSEIDKYIFDYSFTEHNNCTTLRASSYLKRGLFTQQEGSKIGFPIYIKQKSIASIFEFSSLMNGKTPITRVCHRILLFNDYNAQTKTYANNSPTMFNISICQLSSFNNFPARLPKAKIDNISYFITGNNTDRQYEFTASTAFKGNTSLEFKLNLKKFFAFLSIPPNYWVVEIKHGFDVYCGHILFFIKSSQVKIRQITVQQQKYVVSETMKEVVKSVVSIPNIALLLRLAQILNLLDDLSYFIYHNTTYDAAFTYTCNLSWGWVNSKWLPPSFMQSQIDLNLSSGAQPRWVSLPFRQRPQRFQVKGQSMAYLDNCKGFIVYTAPSSTLLFLLLWKIYWLIKEYKMAAVLSTFSSLAYLAVSVVCDNNQYLAFRGFQQLRALEPINFFSLLSYGLAIIGLFLSVFCSFGLFMAAHKTAYRQFRPPILLRAVPSYRFLGIWTGSRFFAGFIHAMIDDSFLRITLLSSLQLLVTVSTVASWRYTRFKTPHMALIIGQAARFGLYLLVCFEVFFPEFAQSLDQTGYLSSISYFMIQIVFIANTSQILLTIFVGMIVTPKDKSFGSPKSTKEQVNKSKKSHGKSNMKRIFVKAQTIRSTKRKLNDKQYAQTERQKSEAEQLRNKHKTHLLVKQSNAIKNTNHSLAFINHTKDLTKSLHKENKNRKQQKSATKHNSH